MAKFSVMIAQTISVYGAIEVTAKDSDAAQAKVQEMLDNQEIPEITWEVPSVENKRIAAIDWQDDSGVTMEIEGVEEC
jgi:hypothetical protein